MADHTVPSLSSPDFPQLLAEGIDRAFDRFIDLIAARPQLHTCDWCDEFCDCREQATVHHLGLEQEFCARHFALAVKRAL